MKIVVKIVFIVLSFFFLYYLSLPNLTFPDSLPGSLQSMEPADTESQNRRAYFTDFDREEAIVAYINGFQLNGTSFLRSIYPLRLNYPPEDANSLIRDQTRSSYLEEISYPFRESLFINGFKASSPKDAILISNKLWLQKLTVKFVSSNRYLRLSIGVLVIMLIIIVARLYVILFTNLFDELTRIRRTKTP